MALPITPPSSPAEPGSTVRVLYVDDDPGLCRLVKRHLQREGFTVTTACDGTSGLALAKGGAFDAVALDHYMPGRDGVDMLSDYLALPGSPPIIFVTAAEEPIIAVTALKHGAFDYVVKDVQGTFMEFLATSIRQSQTQVRLQREREAALHDLQESRDRLEKLAAQQALLLQEVNHRVANSLQLISSLVELQARKVVDADAREALSRAAERVEAVALVHRRLYTGNDVEHVDMDQYLEGLIGELGRAVTAGNGRDRSCCVRPHPGGDGQGGCDWADRERIGHQRAEICLSGRRRGDPGVIPTRCGRRDAHGGGRWRGIPGGSGPEGKRAGVDDRECDGAHSQGRGAYE